MRAWLAPLLLGSVGDASAQADAQRNLRGWIERVGAQEAHRRRPPLPPSIEMALAQGFTYAANRRRHHPHMNSDARSYLVEQAADLLGRSGFWPAQLTLIHALCLWALPDVMIRADAGGNARGRPGTGADHDRIVGWLATAGTHGAAQWPDANSGHPGQHVHPFVEQAAELAESALETGQPEKFLWIDVFGVTSRIGSRAADPSGIRQHNLWIPPSVGWSALEPRAQQLVADVLLLINLADRGDEAEDRERRLQRAQRPYLPPCLSGSRLSLQPERAVSTSDVEGPGSNCVGGCPFGLCPYPPKSGQSYRTEMSDAFSRRQQKLVSRESSLRPRAAPWQKLPEGDLGRFWEAMALRARR
jgi:hypothetical protein